MFCMNCGTKLPDDAKFCYNCGTKIGTLNAPKDIRNSNDTIQEPTTNMNSQQLSSILSDIKDVTPKLHTLLKPLSIEEHLTKAKNILATQEKDNTPITDAQKEILISKFKELALEVEKQYKEISQNYIEANKKIKNQKTGCYAYITGAAYRSCFWVEGDPLDLEAVCSFHASSMHNDIFTALSYSELSEMYLNVSENSDSDNAEENYHLFLYCRDLSLTIFKKIALSNFKIEKAIALKYLAHYYDESGDESKCDYLIKMALTALKEIHSQKGKYIFIAAYHIADIYDMFFDDEEKVEKWVNIAFSDYKFYKAQKDNAKDEDCMHISNYLFAKLCNDYGQSDDRDKLKKIVSEFHNFCVSAVNSDIEAINSWVKQAEKDFEVEIKEYTGSFRYDLVKDVKFNLGDETIFIPSTAATYTKLRAPFMRLANQKYIDFLKFYQINVDNLEDVFNKAIPKAMEDLDDAFDMGTNLANKYGLEIEKPALRDAVISYCVKHARNENYLHIKAIQIAINRILEEADIKAREDANKDYSWVSIAGGFGISGAIGGLILGSLVNAGTNLLADIGRFLCEDTAEQILRSKMNGIYHMYPQIGLWIANLLFDYHEIIFSYVMDECATQHSLPEDEEIHVILSSVINLKQEDRQPDTTYSRKGLLEYLIEASIAPQKLHEIINFLGYNSYFAVLHYNATNDIDIYKKNMENLDWYEIAKQTLAMLHIKATAPINLFSNKQKSKSSTIFTADDLPEEFEDGVCKIPDGYTEIGKSAFAYCTNLREVIVPPSVNCVQDEAFYYCSNLLDISFPRKNYRIGKDVFKGAPNVVVESQLHGSWENYYIEERPTFIDTTTIIEHRFSEFVLYGRNPYRLNHWLFYNESTLSASDKRYEIWGKQDLLTIQESKYKSPINIPINAIVEIEVKNYSFYITYVSQGERNEQRIEHQPISQDYNKIKSLLRYIQHYNHDLISEAFKMLDIDYGGEPYESGIEYALPDTGDSAKFLSWKRVDSEIVFGMPESECIKIERDVLAANNDIELVKIGAKIEKIEDHAFIECTHLRLVQCFNMKCEIGENIFGHSTNVIVRCLPNSDMYRYCLAHHILFYTGEQNPYIYMGIYDSDLGACGMHVGLNRMDYIDFNTYEQNFFADDVYYFVEAEGKEITINHVSFNIEQIDHLELKDNDYINFVLKPESGVNELCLYFSKNDEEDIISFLYYIASYNEYIWQSIDELTKSIDKDKANEYLERCKNKRKEIRDRIFIFDKLLDGEEVVIATKQKQIDFLKNALNNALLRKEEILEYHIKEAFSTEHYNKTMQLLRKEYALNKGGILLGVPGAKIALYIGIMHAKGLGVPISISNAKAWFDVAIQLGDENTKRIANDWKTSIKEAQLNSTSNSNPQNNEPLQGEDAFNTGKYADALPLLQKDYAQGGTRGGKAALYMGIMYAKGLGVSIDISMAKTLFAAAIESGDADTKRTANDWNATISEPQSSSSSNHTTEYSDSLLGEEAFQSGKYTDALPLLQKDYAQGGTRGGKAALYIGIMCAKGLGVQSSIPNAKAWLKIALDLGDDDTKRIAKDWMSTL